jgi:hypothetical protein
MLMPDSGASTRMNDATSAPAATPVQRIHASLFETARTALISSREIMSSAAKAAPAPSVPGVVVT